MGSEIIKLSKSTASAEYTHELAWNTLKDFIESRGNESIYGSKDTTRKAFSLNLIEKNEI